MKINMAASVVSVTSFFLIICMHFSNARLLLPAATIVNLQSTAKPHHFSISLQVSEERTQIGPHVTSSSKGEYGELLTGNAHDMKIDRVSNELGSSNNEHLGVLYSDYARPRTRPPSHN